MKRIFAILLLCFLFVLGYSFYLGAGAVETDVQGLESADSRELEVSSSDGFGFDSRAVRLPSDRDAYSSEASLGELVGVSVQSVAPVQPANDGSLKSVLLSLIGDYDPIVLEYTYSNAQGYSSVLREVQLDYPWLAAAVLFLAVLWCVLKIGGKILWNK